MPGEGRSPNSPADEEAWPPQAVIVALAGLGKPFGVPPSGRRRNTLSAFNFRTSVPELVGACATKSRHLGKEGIGVEDKSSQMQTLARLSIVLSRRLPVSGDIRCVVCAFTC